MLADAVRDFLLKQRLGYVATVSADGSPNLSPKGTVFAWDEDHLVFANIRSPQTVANLQSNPQLEINVVDPLSRRGYRFRGVGHVLEKGGLYEKILSFYHQLGIQSDILDIVLVSVDQASEVTSPLYDLGMSEDQIRKVWMKRLLSG